MILLFNCNAQFEQYNNDRVLTNDNNFVSNNKLITLKLNALNDIVKADATLLNEPTTYAVGTAGLGTTAFIGGVLLPDGKVLLVPRDKGQCYVYGSIFSKNFQSGTLLSRYLNKL